MKLSARTLRHLHRFCIISLIMAVLFVWADVWTDLRAYDQADDDDVISAFCTRLAEEARRGNCSRLLSECGYKSAYQTMDHSGQTLAAAVRGREITYEKNEEDGRYSVFADGELLALVSLDITDHYGFLGLPSYSVVSIEGVRSADYAVKSPSNIYIGDTPLQNLSPVRTGLVFPQFSELKLTTPEVNVPEYLVYHAEGMFTVPSLSSRGTNQFYYPMTELDDGLLLVGDYPELELDEKLGRLVRDAAEKISGFKSGFLEWSDISGIMLGTSPDYIKLENYPDRPQPPDTFEIGEYGVSDFYGWSQNLFGIRARYYYTTSAQGLEVRTEEDLSLYFCVPEGGEDWLICKYTDNLAPAEPAGEDKKDSNEVTANDPKTNL
ncbi:MAG: hypothetical protein IJM17_09510 [Firmicutes bacterium]|nr:hypothetical protein [Bacillota bacterium]